jgi:ABC-type transport system involved in multi-copper enzyme maturation permease subunit
MDSAMVITFLLFLSINIAIYFALFRWASQINEIVKNLESINAKLDMLTGLTPKSQGQETGIEIYDNPKDEALH